MLVRAARLRPRRPRGAALHVRALERQRLPGRRERRGDPAADARRAPQPRHGGDRPPLLARAALEAARDRRDRTYDPALADLFVEHGATWFERLGKTEPWDAVLALEPEPTPPARRRRPRRRARRSPPTSSTSSRRTWAGTAAAARSSRPTPPACSGLATTPSRRSAGRRSCTTSAPRRCRTRSGTSPARSRGRSSTGSSFTRC